MEIIMNKKLLLILFAGLSFAQIKCANSIEQLEAQLAVTQQKIERLYANALEGLRQAKERRQQRLASEKNAPDPKHVHFEKEKKELSDNIIQLILDKGFFWKDKEWYSTVDLGYQRKHPNTFSPKLIKLLKCGYSLHIVRVRKCFKRFRKTEIIQSLESYLRCNRNAKLENLLQILKTGNYYEV
jgi:hypothetical protein